MRTIAARLHRSPSAVSREATRNGGAVRYRAWQADERAGRARRPKVPKLVRCGRLRSEVERLLEKRWSPEQVAHRLVVDHPHDEEMRVSHKTIHRSLFVQARGALRKEFTACLRSGRAQRRPNRRTDLGGRLLDMVMISERPVEASDRAVPGHWEGDLIIGREVVRRSARSSSVRAAS